ncbi:PREDICTED: uncharacterized protein LOC105452019 [Wasmannia auropunctata]|uniref:uncharacterized protein LOC105452019 n=1 Tax=Wasmannia auropunctata TaxID=64793 RepID=UPI0005F09C3A|nr:PREDICTED: uncharacterized protein LOC105452019 [Wasmannia auropunctata]
MSRMRETELSRDRSLNIEEVERAPSLDNDQLRSNPTRISIADTETTVVNEDVINVNFCPVSHINVPTEAVEEEEKKDEEENEDKVYEREDVDNGRQQQHEALRPLNATVVDMNSASGQGLEIRTDIGSILVSGTTLQPFRCSYFSKIHTRPAKIAVCMNTKFTRYLSQRDRYDIQRPHFSTSHNNIEPCATWYEFQCFEIDSHPLFAVFQLDHTSPLFDDMPEYTTCEEEGRLVRVATTAFMHKIMLRAARMLRTDTPTAKTDLKYVLYDVQRSFNVIRREYCSYVRKITKCLLATDLRKKCGISDIRFYMYLHGVRLPKSNARKLLSDMIDIDHDHVDVIQIYRADTLTFKNDDPIVVKLTGRGSDSIASFFEGSIDSQSTQRYYVGFTADYGYFTRYASPPFLNHAITFVQACHEATMEKSANSGLLGAFAICRGYADANRKLKKTAAHTRQHLHYLLAFCEHYMRKRQALRVEEVITLDTLRIDGSMSEEITRLKIFQQDEMCVSTSYFLRHGTLYRLSNWNQYMDLNIGDDLRFLHSVLHSTYESYGQDTWTSPQTIRRTIRADFRVTYFVNGLLRTQNFQIAKNMFCGTTESRSIDRGRICLRELNDPTDTSIYPFFTHDIRNSVMNIIRFIWNIICTLPDPSTVAAEEFDDVKENDGSYDDDLKGLRFLVCLYASWAYNAELVHHDTASSAAKVTVDSVNVLRYFNEWKNVFSLQFFIDEHRRKGVINCCAKITKQGIEEQNASHLALLDPQTMFANVVMMCIRTSNRPRMINLLSKFINRRCQVLPVHLLKQHSKQYDWAVVINAATLPGNVHVSAGYVQQQLNILRQRANQRRCLTTELRGTRRYRIRTTVRSTKRPVVAAVVSPRHSRVSKRTDSTKDLGRSSPLSSSTDDSNRDEAVMRTHVAMTEGRSNQNIVVRDVRILDRLLSVPPSPSPSSPLSLPTSTLDDHCLDCLEEPIPSMSKTIFVHPSMSPPPSTSSSRASAIAADCPMDERFPSI